MITELFLARRFFSSRYDGSISRFTRLTAIIGVGLGCAALIVSMSVLNGYTDLITEVSQRMGADIEIRRIGGPLAETDAADIVSIIQATPGVSDVQQSFMREAVVRVRGQVDGALLLGLKHSHIASRLSPLTNVDLGSVTGNRVLVGEVFAKSLKLRIGDTVIGYTLRSAADRAIPTIVRLQVAGILSTGLHEYDASVIVVDYDFIRSRISSDTDAGDYYLVDVEPGYDEDVVRAGLERSLGLSWSVLTPSLRHYSMFSWIEIQRKPIPIVLGLLSLVAIVTVVSTLLISVVNKAKTIAVLRVMGVSNRSLGFIVLLHSLIISGLGALAGSIISLGFLLLQKHTGIVSLESTVYYVLSLPVSITLTPFVVVITTAVVIAAVSALAPIAVLSRYNPSSVLRFE